VHGIRKTGQENARGFSLIEMMVASAIFAIAAAVAFILYSAAQKSYKAGENYTDQQQSTRVAFDRMISDIRLAGFNTNPDGDAARVDEQIEGAWDTAVTIRGDFDFEDPTASVTPEASLPGLNYNVVSTGNDEIVTYILAKPGPVGGDTLTLRVDADRPRARALKTITIPNVVLVQDNPPYTLYRVSLADVNGVFPLSPQASSNFVYEPVAENIRTMTFLYYDDAGTLISPNTPANSGDDIGGGDAQITARGKVRRVAVSIVGMTSDEDLDYTDPADATATSHFRKFDLQSDVNPENLGKTGVKDIDITPPPTPSNVAVVPGHCQGMLVKWDQPAPTSGVTSYVIKFYPSATPSAFTTRSFTYPHIEYGTVDYLGHGFVSGLAMGTNYCFQVQARDLGGNQSGWAPAVSPPCAVVTNTTTPGAPQNVTASYYSTNVGMPSSLDGKIHLNWDELKVNTVATSLAGDPNSILGATILRDFTGYKLYRDVSSSFATPVVAKTATDLPIGILTIDDTVPSCKDFFYKLSGVDICGTEGPQSAIVTGRANTSFDPAPPTNASAVRSSQNNILVQWTAVTTNNASPPAPIAVEKYGIWRAVGPSTSSWSDPSLTYTKVAEPIVTVTPPSYSDDILSIKNQLKSQKAFYRVSALDYCNHESAQSDGAAATCPFGGTLQVSPASGTGGGDIPLSMWITLPSDPTYTGKVHITRDSDGYGPSDIFFPSVGGSPSTATWVATANDTGVYTLYWEVENDRGCISSTSTKYTRSNSLPCKLTASAVALGPSSGSPKTNRLTLNLTNTYTKGLDINKITVVWTNPGTRHIGEIQLPTGTSYCGPGANKLSPAVCTPAFLAPRINPGASNGTLNVWDASVAGETITLIYDYTDTVSLPGTCTFCISPALAVTTSTSGSCP